MHSAIGYCSSHFHPSDPGRLCRGRERWIQAFESEPVASIHRLVVSGACFTDDSARDAQRGLLYSGFDVATMVRKLFPEQCIVSWAEDAHPRQVPAEARGLEAYDQAMPRGPLRRWAVRWSMQCTEDEQIREALNAGSDVLMIFDSPPPEAQESSLINTNTGAAPLADGHLDPQNQGGLSEELRGLLFLLTGYRTAGPPFRGFQPTAIPELLAQDGCIAVILLHQDKHAPCIGIYTAGDGEDDLNRLQALGLENGFLVVPFAIPPMLARWDRALWELRQTWDVNERGEFPVTESSDGRSWGRRGHHETTPKVEEPESPSTEETADTVTEEDKPTPPSEAQDSSESNETEEEYDGEDGEDGDNGDDGDDGDDGDNGDDGEDGDTDAEEAFPDDDFGDLDDAFADIDVSDEPNGDEESGTDEDEDTVENTE